MRMRAVILLWLAFCELALATDVLTQHDNPARTGAVLDEMQLDPNTLNDKHFGRLFSFAVVGQIYAQPLIVSGLQFPDKVRNVLYVATMRNWVYAFDADGNPAVPLWSKNLGAPLPFDRIPKDAGAILGQYNIQPFIGITSTPVIDRARGRIYVVAKIADPPYPCPDTDEASKDCPVVYRIHALDLVNGDFVYKDITIPIPMPDDPIIPRVKAEDVARRHLQRPGLLLANNKIYVAFGSHQDALPWQGWVIAFDADSLEQQQTVFCTTPGGKSGGIWQAGNGPAADGQGNIYMMIGNGSYSPGKQFGSNFVKLNPDLTHADWFAPANVDALNDLDIDLGSAGPMLMPDTDELVGGGKQGKLYLLKQSNLGGQQRHHCLHDELNPPVQFFQASRRWRLTWLSWIPFLFHAGYHHIHGSPVYWNSAATGPTVYVWPEEDNVKAYHYSSTAKFNTRAVKGMIGNQGMPGGFLSISANGRENGILWAAIPCEDDAFVRIVRGCFRAFDANTLRLLWSSDKNDPADYFDFAKYVPPTIANGKVYLATFSDRVNVYGLNSPIATQSLPAPNVSRDPRHRGHVKGASGHSTHQH